MRLVLRILGTWLLGLAVVLLVIDGTKSLGANGLVLTSLGQGWTSVHQASLLAVQAFFGEQLGGALQGPLAAVLGYPAFAVVAVLGVLLTLLGRSRRRDGYIKTDQI